MAYQEVLKPYKDDETIMKWIPHWINRIEKLSLISLKQELKQVEWQIHSNENNAAFQKKLEELQETNPEYAEKLSEVQYIKRSILQDLINHN